MHGVDRRSSPLDESRSTVSDLRVRSTSKGRSIVPRLICDLVGKKQHPHDAERQRVETQTDARPEEVSFVEFISIDASRRFRIFVDYVRPILAKQFGVET